MVITVAICFEVHTVIAGIVGSNPVTAWLFMLLLCRKSLVMG